MGATLTVGFKTKPDKDTLRLVLQHLSENATGILEKKEVSVGAFYINEGGSPFNDAIVHCPCTVRLEEKG